MVFRCWQDGGLGPGFRDLPNTPKVPGLEERRSTQRTEAQPAQPNAPGEQPLAKAWLHLHT